MCGEYGDELLRPHFHACIFNLDFTDKVLFKVINNNKIYISGTLDDLWNKGYSTIGDLNFNSAAYIARYCIKGSKEDKAVIFGLQLEPEYLRMSNRPGIGQKWYKRYKQDITILDEVIIKDKLTSRIPRYYNKLLAIDDVEEYRRIRNRREAKICKKDNTPDRLAVKEEIKKGQLKQLKRSYDNEKDLFGKG